MRSLGIEVELRWAPEDSKGGGMMEANHAALDGAKYMLPIKGPGAFLKDVRRHKRVVRDRAAKRERRKRR